MENDSKPIPPRARPVRFRKMVAIEKPNGRDFLGSKMNTSFCSTKSRKLTLETGFRAVERVFKFASNKAIVPNLFRGGKNNTFGISERGKGRHMANVGRRAE